jgi:hypothetical protein
VGDVLLLQEKLEECRSHYTESLEIRRKVQTTDESSHIAKIDVAQGLLRLGDLEIKAVQKEKAREFLNEALGILTPLKEADLLQAAADQLLLETVQQKLKEVTP